MLKGGLKSLKFNIPKPPPPGTKPKLASFCPSFSSISFGHRLLWTGTLTFLCVPILQHWFPNMFPVMNSPATPNPVEASSDKESFAVEKLQHYGIVQADRRVKVYETEYQKGAPNSILSFGSSYYIRLLVPAPHLMDPTTPFGTIFPALKNKYPDFAAQTPRDADQDPTFIERRKAVIKSERILPLTEKENDVVWRSTAAAIQLKLASRPYTIGLVAMGSLWVIGKMLLRPPFVVKPLHPFIHNRLAELPILASLIGILWTTRTLGNLHINRLVGNDLETAKTALQLIEAQKLYNLARGGFFIDVKGNDFSEIYPLRKKEAALKVIIEELSELDEFFSISEVFDRVDDDNAKSDEHSDNTKSDEQSEKKTDQ